MSDTNSTVIKFCKVCQCETARYQNGRCKPCAAVHAASWKAANPDKTKAIKAAWQKANKDKQKSATAAWSAANPERAKAIVDAWRKANPEKVKASRAARYMASQEQTKATNAAWRANNLDKVKATSAAWARENIEAKRIHAQNRRSRKLESGGILSKGLSDKLFNLQRGKCACCRLPLGDEYHLDHILPIALGGTNTDDNIQLLRAVCNRQKHTKHPVDFMQSRGFLL